MSEKGKFQLFWIFHHRYMMKQLPLKFKLDHKRYRTHSLQFCDPTDAHVKHEMSIPISRIMNVFNWKSRGQCEGYIRQYNPNVWRFT